MKTLKRIHRLIDEKPYILAVTISLLILLWMLSGSSQADENKIKENNIALPKVKVEYLSAKQVHKTLMLYGKSEPDKMATISAREPGEVNTILVAEGQFVQQGAIILTLDESDLNQQIQSTKSLVMQRELEYQGSVKLKQKGLQDEVQLARNKAQLDQANAQLAGLLLNLERTKIKAPFSGVINKQLVEVGDYVGRGDAILELADLDPLIVRADVTQAEILGLELEQPVSVTLIDKNTYAGKIRYIASVADGSTNTFRIEAAFDNPGMKFKAGFSTQLDINVNAVNAIHLSPAFMALDDQGSIGVKTLNEKNEVIFTPIQIVKSQADGIWMSGLGDKAKVITLGQGFVRAGDVVEPVFSTEQVSLNDNSSELN